MVFGHRDLFRDDQRAAPSVLDSDYTEDAEEFEPEPPRPQVAYVPTDPASLEQDVATVRLWPTGQGQAMFAFTTAEALASCLGSEQTWVTVSDQEVESLRRSSGADLVRWDPTETQ